MESSIGKNDLNNFKTKEKIPVSFSVGGGAAVKMQKVAESDIDFIDTQSLEGEAREKFILDNMSLVKSTALGIYNRIPKNSMFQLGDLIHHGFFGLLEAMKLYRPDTGIPFQNFARFRIKGAIQDELREQDPLSRDTRKNIKRIEKMLSKNKDLTDQNKNSLTDKEMAKQLKISANDFIFYKSNIGMNSHPVSLESFIEDRGDSFPDNKNKSSEQLAHQREIKEIVESALKKFLLSVQNETSRKRFKEIFREYYEEGKPMKDIGLRHGINESRISQIIKKMQDEIKIILEASGFDPESILWRK